MEYRLTKAGQCVAATLFIALGAMIYGCSDTASVNPAAELAGLTVNPGTLQPAFNGSTTQYNVDVSTNITSVTITAQPAVAGDTVTINGQTTTSSVITLGAAGTTTPVSIVVSESGTSSKGYTVLLIRAGITGNNSLQNLTVSPGTLAPPFDPNVQVYTVSVAGNVGSVSVAPTLSDPAATMTVNGQVTLLGQGHTIPLNGGGQSTTITITVTAQNGTSKSYLVSVSRGVSNNNTLRSLTISPGTLNFRPDTTSYTVNVASTVTSVTVQSTPADAAASMIVNGQATDSGQARTIALNEAGSNTLTNIIVIAQNGDPKTYTINITRPALAGNNNLSALIVTPGPLTPAFASNRLTYSVDAAEDVTSVTVSATKSDSNAVMSGSVTAGAGTATGQATIPLDGPGTNTVVSITVDAAGQSPKTYTITIERGARAGNNNLSALTVSPGTLAPPFSPSTTRYAVDVSSNVTSVTVTAVPQDTTAGMEVNGQGAGSGQAREIALGEEGSNTTITIRVTPPNGNAKTYTITIERGARAGNNNLQSLAVSPGSLTPAFTAARTRYTVDVESPVTSVMVTAALQDTTAGMEVNGQGTSSGQSREISLGTEGSSTAITIRVIPPNGNAKTYTITVNRASSGDSGNDGGKGNKGGNGNNGGKGNKRNNGNKGDNGNGGDGGQSE
jgi:hypothetical protein